LVKSFDVVYVVFSIGILSVVSANEASDSALDTAWRVGRCGWQVQE